MPVIEKALAIWDRQYPQNKKLTPRECFERAAEGERIPNYGEVLSQFCSILSKRPRKKQNKVGLVIIVGPLKNSTIPIKIGGKKEVFHTKKKKYSLTLEREIVNFFKGSQEYKYVEVRRRYRI